MRKQASAPTTLLITKQSRAIWWTSESTCSNQSVEGFTNITWIWHPEREYWTWLDRKYLMQPFCGEVITPFIAGRMPKQSLRHTPFERSCVISSIHTLYVFHSELLLTPFYPKLHKLEDPRPASRSTQASVRLAAIYQVTTMRWPQCQAIKKQPTFPEQAVNFLNTKLHV